MTDFYGYALIAGIGLKEARHLAPGFILDMYLIRCRHDARLAGIKIPRKTGLML